MHFTPIVGALALALFVLPASAKDHGAGGESANPCPCKITVTLKKTKHVRSHLSHRRRHGAGHGRADRVAHLPGHDASSVLVTLRTKAGHPFIVAARYAAKFSGFIRDLEATGYRIDFVGGLRHTRIAGTGHLSKHASGAAIDVNQTARDRVTRRMDRRQVSRIAARWGLTSGGDWRHGDLGHFEIPNLHRIVRRRVHWVRG